MHMCCLISCLVCEIRRTTTDIWYAWFPFFRLVFGFLLHLTFVYQLVDSICLLLRLFIPYELVIASQIVWSMLFCQHVSERGEEGNSVQEWCSGLRIGSIGCGMMSWFCWWRRGVRCSSEMSSRWPELEMNGRCSWRSRYGRRGWPGKVASGSPWHKERDTPKVDNEEWRRWPEQWRRRLTEAGEEGTILPRWCSKTKLTSPVSTTWRCDLNGRDGKENDSPV